jgi:hypothetical protein
LVALELVEIFDSVDSSNVAEFCIEMYQKMGLLEGIEIVRSSDPELREKAIKVNDYFLDTPHEGEIVRARHREKGYCLFKGGGKFIPIEVPVVRKSMISPARDTRLRWMQSAVHCTHYIAGEGEIQYLNQSDAPEIEFVKRDFIERSGDAYAERKNDW